MTGGRPAAMQGDDEFTGHTPGPWEIRGIAHEATPLNTRRVYRVEVVAPQFYMGRRTGSRFICQIVDYCEWIDHPANARLIAAAPQMASDLSSLRAEVERLREQARKATSAFRHEEAAVVVCRQRVALAEAENARLREAQTWQPKDIETAPTDGTQVLAWDDDRGWNPAMYIAEAEAWFITYDDAVIQPTFWLPFPGHPMGWDNGLTPPEPR